MWSGPQWTQWALNPSAYQDMANDQVDWARLAQQWIMMKESEPVAHPPVVEKHMEEEGGEAPMDIGKDEDEPNDAPSSGAPPSGGWNNSSNWNNWQQQWGGYNSWPPGSQGSQIPQSASNSLLPTPSVPKNGADNAAYSYSTANSGFEYSTMGHREDGFQTPSGYWPDGVIPPGAGGAQMPFVRGGPGRGHRWEGKVKYPRGADMPPSDEEEEAEPVIDAAKRRSLPIWIREGLEKMEREKQKRMEREKAEREREEVIKQRRQQEQEAMNEIQAEKGIPPKSKFDTDSGEESEGEAARHMSSSPSPIELVEPPKRKSRFHDGPPKPSSPVRLTKEEQMLKVRRSMTEILLEVTNEMIHSVARDSYLAAQRKVCIVKAPAKQTPPKKSMAVASLTGNLGLAMYGSGSEGDSDSDSDQEGEASRQRKGANSSGDSDSELKDEIRRRQQDFREKEREIEAFAAEAEDRERRGGRGSSVGNNQAAAVTSAQQVVTDSGNGLIPERQVESESASHTTDGVKEDKGKTEVDNSNADRKSNDKNSYKSLKTDKKKKSESSHSSDESSSSSRDSKRKHKRKHKERRKEKRRSKERDKRRRDRSESRSPSRRVRDRKSRRDRSSSSKRSKSRSRSRHRDDEKKRKQRRDRSDSRRRSRKRSHSSDSDYRRHRRRSRSRSGSSRRHRRRRSSSRSSSQSSRHHRSARR